MDKELLIKLFGRFASKDGRIGMESPMKSGEYSLATDAHIMIYTKHDLGFQKTTKTYVANIIPNSEGTFTEVDVQSVLKQISDKTPMIEELEEPEDCEECSGEGELECDLGHTHECDACNGKGTFGPPRPTGKKIPDPNAVFSFLGQNLQQKYLLLIFDTYAKLGIEKVYKTHGDGFSTLNIKSDVDVNILHAPTKSTANFEIVID